MAPKSLFDIPDEVLQSFVFPYLLVNELLRLRRVCTWTKVVSEDYLRRHPRSSNKILFDMTLVGHQDQGECGEQSLEIFLQEDRESSIRKPISRFRLTWGRLVTETVLQSALFDEFLEKYGNQVAQIEVSRMSLPLGENEFKFYEKLGKLRSLTVNQVEVDVRKKITDVEFNFPASFRELRRIKIHNGEHSMQGYVWKLVEFCKKLEYYATPVCADFAMLFQVLKEKKHRNFKFYDMKHYVVGYSKFLTSKESIPELCEMSVISDVKWVNVSSRLLTTLEKTSLEKIAPQIVSTRGFFGREDFGGAVFPYVKEIRVVLGLWEVPSPRVFPGLKKLQISVSVDFRTAGILCMFWSRFPNLEEVKFKGSGRATDAVFMGVQGEPPFLQLTKLKKLTLGNVHSSSPTMTSLTDAAFEKVFRHMRLHELHMTSKHPLTLVTSTGIRTLLNSPFRETIEAFPFRGWSLGDLDKQQFYRLAREFPNNQSL